MSTFEDDLKILREILPKYCTVQVIEREYFSVKHFFPFPNCVHSNYLKFSDMKWDVGKYLLEVSMTLIFRYKYPDVYWGPDNVHLLPVNVGDILIKIIKLHDEYRSKATFWKPEKRYRTFDKIYVLFKALDEGIDALERAVDSLLLTFKLDDKDGKT